MAPTLTRLILSLSLIVAAPVVYTIIFVSVVEITGYHHDETALLAANGVTGIGFAIGWLLIWMFEIRWTVLRVTLTAGVFFASIVAAVTAGVILTMLMGQDGLGLLFGGMLWAVFWMFGTSLAWMELPAERRQRLAGLGDDAVACPACGYNLTGLSETRCPECGARYTIDQLFAAHRAQQKTLGSG